MKTGIFFELHRIAAMAVAPKLTQDEPRRSETVSHRPEGLVLESIRTLSSVAQEAYALYYAVYGGESFIASTT